MQERREGIRVELDVDVSEKLIAGSSKAKAVSLSTSGMRYLKPGHTPRHNSKEVFLEFSLADDMEPIKVMGWVVEEIERDNHLETAVTFMFLPEGDEAKISSFVGRNSS